MAQAQAHATEGNSFSTSTPSMTMEMSSARLRASLSRITKNGHGGLFKFSLRFLPLISLKTYKNRVMRDCGRKKNNNPSSENLLQNLVSCPTMEVNVEPKRQLLTFIKIS